MQGYEIYVPCISSGPGINTRIRIGGLNNEGNNECLIFTAKKKLVDPSATCGDCGLFLPGPTNKNVGGCIKRAGTVYIDSVACVKIEPKESARVKVADCPKRSVGVASSSWCNSSKSECVYPCTADACDEVQS
jgi:hypothetical protein